jgi:hypothetical protein
MPNKTRPRLELELEPQLNCNLVIGRKIIQVTRKNTLMERSKQTSEQTKMRCDKNYITHKTSGQ